MPKQQTPLNELGGILRHNEDYFCARVQYRNESGLMCSIQGPDRCDKKRAQSDLEHLRGAGSIGKTREQGLEYMKAEAQRIKVEAMYQADLDAAAQRLKAQEEKAQQEEEAVALSDEEPTEEPWMKDDEELLPKPVAPPPDSRPLLRAPGRCQSACAAGLRKVSPCTV